MRGVVTELYSSSRIIFSGTFYCRWDWDVSMGPFFMEGRPRKVWLTRGLSLVIFNVVQSNPVWIDRTYERRDGEIFHTRRWLCTYSEMLISLCAISVDLYTGLRDFFFHSFINVFFFYGKHSSTFHAALGDREKERRNARTLAHS